MASTTHSKDCVDSIPSPARKVKGRSPVEELATAFNSKLRLVNSGNSKQIALLTRKEKKLTARLEFLRERHKHNKEEISRLIKQIAFIRQEIDYLKRWQNRIQSDRKAFRQLRRDAKAMFYEDEAEAQGWSSAATDKTDFVFRPMRLTPFTQECETAVSCPYRIVPPDASWERRTEPRDRNFACVALRADKEYMAFRQKCNSREIQITNDVPFFVKTGEYSVSTQTNVDENLSMAEWTSDKQAPSYGFSSIKLRTNFETRHLHIDGVVEKYSSVAREFSTTEREAGYFGFMLPVENVAHMVHRSQLTGSELDLADEIIEEIVAEAQAGETQGGIVSKARQEVKQLSDTVKDTGVAARSVTQTSDCIRNFIDMMTEQGSMIFTNLAKITIMDINMVFIGFAQLLLAAYNGSFAQCFLAVSQIAMSLGVAGRITAIWEEFSNYMRGTEEEERTDVAEAQSYEKVVGQASSTLSSFTLLGGSLMALVVAGACKTKQVNEFMQSMRLFGQAKHGFNCAKDCFMWLYEWARDAFCRWQFGVSSETIDLQNIEPHIEEIITNAQLIRKWDIGLYKLSKDLCAATIATDDSLRQLETKLTLANMPLPALTVKTLQNDLRGHTLAALTSPSRSDLNRCRPFSLWIYGASGVGKSVLVKWFQQKYAAKYLETDSSAISDYVFARKSANEYWDGYKNQPIVYYDDALQTKDSTTMPNPEIMELIYAINDAPYHLHMASLSQKTSSYFDSQFVLCTSNTRCPSPVSIKDRKAFTRRFDLAIEITVKPKFATKGALDSAKVSKYMVEHARDESEFCEAVYEIRTYDMHTGNYDTTYNLSTFWHAFCDAKEKCDKHRIALKNSMGIKKEDSLMDKAAQLAKSLKPVAETQSKETKITTSPASTSSDSSSASTTPIPPLSDSSSESEGSEEEDSESEEEEEYVDIDADVVCGCFFNKCYEKQILEDPGINDCNCVYKDWFCNKVTYGSKIIKEKISISDASTKSPEDVRQTLDSLSSCVIEKTKTAMSAGPLCEQLKQEVKAGSISTFEDMMAHLKTDKEVSIKFPTFAKVTEEAKRLKEYISSQLARLHKAGTKIYEIFQAIFNSKTARWLGVVAAGLAGIGYFNVTRCKVLAARTLDGLKNATLCRSSCDACATFNPAKAEAGNKKGPLCYLRGWCKKLFSTTKDPKFAEMAFVAESQSREILTKAAARKTTAIVQADEIPVSDSANFLAKTGLEPKVEAKAQSGDVVLVEQWEKIVKHNLVVLRSTIITSEGETLIRTINALYISGRTLMTPAHWFKTQCGPTFELLNYGSITGPEIRVRDIAITYVKDLRGREQDMCMFTAPPNIRCGAKITNFFAPAADIHKIKRAKMLLSGYKHLGEHKVLFTSTVTKQQILDYEVGITTRSGPNTTCKAHDVIFYDVTTEQGMCGSLLFAACKGIPGKIIGMHYAGLKGDGISIVLSRELIQNAITKHTDDYEIDTYGFVDVKVPSYVDTGTQPAVQAIAQGDCHYVGKAKPVPVSGKTQISPSILAGNLGECITKPAHLRPFQLSDGTTIDPMTKGIAKMLGKVPTINVSILKEALSDTYITFFASLPEDSKGIGVLTYEEAIDGVIRNEELREKATYVKPLNRSSSAGYPWVLQNKGQGKHHWFGYDDKYLYSDEVRETVMRMINSASQGCCEVAVYCATLKDERRPIEKVNAGKTRVFCAAPMHFVIACRMYFLGFANEIMSRHKISECAVGIDPYSLSWDFMYHKLCSLGNGRNIIAGDFSNFDGSLRGDILAKVCDLICYWYTTRTDMAGGFDNCDNLIRHVLFENIQSHHVLVGSDVYQMTHSQPSGNPLTVIINSIYNMIVCRYAYYYCLKEFLLTPEGGNTDDALCAFHDNVVLVAYGDDNLLSVSERAKCFFTPQNMARALLTIGHIYTSSDKTSELHFQTVEEVSFLKRKFKYHNELQRFVAALDTDVIAEMCRWVRGKEKEEATKQNVHDAAREAVLHGLHFYESFRTWISSACRANEFFVDLLPYDLALAHFKGDMAGEECDSKNSLGSLESRQDGLNDSGQYI